MGKNYLFLKKIHLLIFLYIKIISSEYIEKAIMPLSMNLIDKKIMNICVSSMALITTKIQQ